MLTTFLLFTLTADGLSAIVAGLVAGAVARSLLTPHSRRASIEAAASTAYGRSGGAR